MIKTIKVLMVKTQARIYMYGTYHTGKLYSKLTKPQRIKKISYINSVREVGTGLVLWVFNAQEGVFWWGGGNQRNL